jgi:DnaJ-domain-containing protein 1
MPEKLREYFYLSQIALGACFLIALWFLLRGRSGSSNFRVREADLRPGKGKSAGRLGEARMKPAPKPLSLPGIRLEGAPHEVLGIRAGASVDEIQTAYRDLMKRYHPDRVLAAPGSQAWKDAQRVAEAINRAREEALKLAGKVRS